jgi:hypothetical protein
MSEQDLFLKAGMEAIRNQLIAALEAHDRREHQGTPCPGSRVNAVAYLAHCVGVHSDNGDAMDNLHQLMFEYERDCPDCINRREQAG